MSVFVSNNHIALAEQGVQVVECDFGNFDDLKRAFKGAYGVYGMTNCAICAIAT